MLFHVPSGTGFHHPRVGGGVYTWDRGDAPAANVTVFEGARLILGDGSDPIDNGAILVQDDRITGVGGMGQLEVPAGAARVDLTGKTVMPAIVDAHKHVADTREGLVDQLEQFAYFGVGTVLSLGLDGGNLAFQIRNETSPGAARLRTAGRGITAPEPGRSEVPQWVTTEEEARTAIQELAEPQVDWVKIWVDDRNGQYEKLSPALYSAVIDEAHSHNLPVAAHIFALEDAKGLLEAGVDAFAHSVRDRDVDDEFVAMIQERPDVFLIPNLPGRGVVERHELVEPEPSRGGSGAAAGGVHGSARSPGIVRHSGPQFEPAQRRRRPDRSRHGWQLHLGPAR